MKSSSKTTFDILNACGVGVRKNQAQLRRLLLEEGIDVRPAGDQTSVRRLDR